MFGTVLMGGLLFTKIFMCSLKKYLMTSDTKGNEGIYFPSIVALSVAIGCRTSVKAFLNLECHKRLIDSDWMTALSTLFQNMDNIIGFIGILCLSFGLCCFLQV